MATPSGWLPHSTGGIFDLPSYAHGSSAFGEAGAQEESSEAPYLTFQSPVWPLAATELGLMVMERLELQRMMREQLLRCWAARAAVRSSRLQEPWLRVS